MSQRIEEHDPYKGSKYSSTRFYRDYFFTKNWFRRGLHYRPDMVLSSGGFIICGILVAAFIPFAKIENRLHETQYKKEYTVIRSQDADQELKEKGFYN